MFYGNFSVYCMLLYFIGVFVHYLIEQSVIYGLVIALYSSNLSIFTVNLLGGYFCYQARMLKLIPLKVSSVIQFLQRIVQKH